MGAGRRLDEIPDPDAAPARASRARLDVLGGGVQRRGMAQTLLAMIPIGLGV